MKTSRREFVQTMSAGAIGLGLSSTIPSVEAQAGQAYQVTKTGGRKMVIRGDDVGFTKVCNIGSFESIENGVVTTAAVMLECPGTEDALERLKVLPWISVDWHTHMWGTPVLESKLVPSLIEKEGPFAGRFRTDLGSASDVVYDEALAELRAQLDRCIKILGRVPDTGGGGSDRSPWGRAMKQVTEQYGLIYDFVNNVATDKSVVEKITAAQKAGEEWAKYYSAEPSPASKCDPKYADRKIYKLSNLGYIDIWTDRVSELEKNYDPVKYYTNDLEGILKYPEDVIIARAWHPGYVDYYVYRLGERVNRPRAQQFTVSRTQDVAALTDPRLKNWIKANHIELISYKDAVYGTREYQNHLKLAGSDLYIA